MEDCEMLPSIWGETGRKYQKGTIADKAINSNKLEEFCLPLDVLFEVFLRITAEDILKLKRVSKLWYNLISGRDFVRAHLQRRQEEDSPPNILVKHNGNCRSFNLKTMRYNQLCFDTLSSRHIIVVDSLDGLVLFIRYDPVYLCNPITQRCKFLLVCNPITQRCKLLLETPWGLSFTHRKLVFDPKLQKYKVVGICCFFGESKQEYYVIILGLDGKEGNRRIPTTWREMETKMGVEISKNLENVMLLHSKPVVMSDSVAIKGVLYWIAGPSNPSENPNELGVNFIESMDFVKKELEERIQLPFQNKCYSKDIARLNDMNGELCLKMLASSCNLGIWVWKKDLNKLSVWVKQHEINLCPTIVEDDRVELYNLPVGVFVMDSNKSKLENIIFHKSGSLHSYNLKSGNVTNMDINIDHHPYKFVHSLISWD